MSEMSLENLKTSENFQNVYYVSPKMKDFRNYQNVNFVRHNLESLAKNNKMSIMSVEK